MREMKDSGIEWVGQIPVSWDVLRNKYNFVLGKDLIGVNWEKTQLLSLTKYGVKAITPEEQTGKVPTSFSTYQIVKKDDMIMCLFDLDVSAVFAGISPYYGMISPAYKCFKCKSNLNPKYADYYYRTVFVDRKYKRYSKNVRYSLGTEDFFALPMLIPSIDEQRRIADFLDAKCAEIEALTADIEKQIETLEAYKHSVITEAVTRGLNLDVEVQESRIFYVPPYNSSWRLSRIGYECTKLLRSFNPDDTALICSNKGKVLVRPDDMMGRMVSEDNAMQGIHKGDIAIHGMDTWHGAIACSDFDGKITRVVHVCDSHQEKRFIVYYLRCLAYQGVYKLISNGIRGNTSDFRSWDKVKEIYIPLPDISEQKDICDFLDRTCSEIESMISEKNNLLEVLAEYKNSLIYEYVTGKKEVEAT